MSRLTNVKDFTHCLNALPLSRQRQVAARFITDVLDLRDDPRIRHAVEVAAKDDATPEELEAAYHAVHAIYVESHPQSDLSELDFARQAAHFVAEACLACLSPLYLSPSYQQGGPCRLAQKVAMYCRMARTCASMHHDDDAPDFSAVGPVVERVMQEQYRIAEAVCTG